MQDIANTVTNRIIEELEKGVAPWVKPWAPDYSAPYNPSSRNFYKGINHLYLSVIQQSGVYGSSNFWLTYKQAADKGAQVKKGAKGVQVVFFKPLSITAKDEATNEDVSKTIPLMRTYTVFNADMIEGLDLPALVPNEFNPIEHCEDFIQNTGANIQHGGDRACFVPSLDIINLPKPEAFKTEFDYYATAFHELAHWTGHESRLNRLKNDRFGSEGYAFEELIAELSASMLCAHNHIEAQLQHASYIESWLKALKNDKKYIFKAAAQAQKVLDYFTKDSESIVE